MPALAGHFFFGDFNTSGILGVSYNCLRNLHVRFDYFRRRLRIHIVQGCFLFHVYFIILIIKIRYL